MQIEECRDVGAFDCDDLSRMDGADDFSDAFACELARRDAGGQQLAEEFLYVGLGVVLGVPHGQKEPPTSQL